MILAVAAPLLATAIVAPLVAMGAVARPATAPTPPNGSANFTYQTLDNNNDLTFNQLLGINDEGQISGYFGIGSATHPNKGYLLLKPYSQSSYINENYPGSVQTQVTGLNDSSVKTTVGFEVDSAGNNEGWYAINRKNFTIADPPAASGISPVFDQLLGVNNSNVAVGFYNDSSGNAHGYTYNIATKTFGTVTVSGAVSVTPAAINNEGDIAGYDKNAKGATNGFLKQSGGSMITIDFPGASATFPTGVNDGDEVVGSYTMGTATHGFIWAPGFGFETIDDPSGIGTTTINGVNDRGQVVGFYTDSSNNVDGMLATPMP